MVENDEWAVNSRGKLIITFSGHHSVNGNTATCNLTGNASWSGENDIFSASTSPPAGTAVGSCLHRYQCFILMNEGVFMQTKRLIKKISIIVAVGVAVIAFFKIIDYISLRNISPYNYVMSTAYDPWKPQELLLQDESEVGIDLVFYRNQGNVYNCALLRKNFWGGYETIRYSGSLGIYQDDTYLYTGFSLGQNRYGIYWGILTDEEVTTVYLDKKECQIRTTPYTEFRIFWLLESCEPDDVDPVLTKV